MEDSKCDIFIIKYLLFLHPKTINSYIMKKCKIQWLLCALVVVLVACGNSNAKQTDEVATANEVTEISDNQAATPAAEQSKVVAGELNVISSDEFVKLITDIDNPKGFQYKGTTPCIVDFYANWCGPCRQIQPMMERMAKKYKGKLIIYKLNVDNAREICDRFGIQSIPTLMFFKRTVAPTRMVGAPTESELDAAINDFLNK